MVATFQKVEILGQRSTFWGETVKSNRSKHGHLYLRGGERHGDHILKIFGCKYFDMYTVQATKIPRSKSRNS